MLYNRCTGICKFGYNTYPRRIRHRSNLGHIFRGKKSASYGPEITVIEVSFLLYMVKNLCLEKWHKIIHRKSSVMTVGFLSGIRSGFIHHKAGHVPLRLALFQKQGAAEMPRLCGWLHFLATLVNVCACTCNDVTTKTVFGYHNSMCSVRVTRFAIK
jgi:hypothetical protein